MSGTDSQGSLWVNGVARPVFYQGEQVGERRYYNERLTQFLLRYRDPVRYGAWLDGYEVRRHPDGAGIILAKALNIVLDSAHGFDPPVDRDGIERPLGDGPLPESERAIDDEEYDEKFADLSREAREMKKVLDNAFRRDAAPDADDEAHDWRDPLTALRRPREQVQAAVIARGKSERSHHVVRPLRLSGLILTPGPTAPAPRRAPAGSATGRPWRTAPGRR